MRLLTLISVLSVLLFGSIPGPALAKRPDGVGGGQRPTSAPGNDKPIPSRGNPGRNSGATTTTSTTLSQPGPRFVPTQ